MKERAESTPVPGPADASLIVTWNEDAGNVGRRVAEYLIGRLKAKSFSEIEPERFFAMSGVTVVNDVARFPESRFYAGERNDIAVLTSNQPTSGRHEFLNAVLDTAGRRCSVIELYTVNGTAAPIAHTARRRLLAAFNQPELRQNLQRHGTEDLTYEGPPAVSSYLLWMARERHVPGVGLWPEVAFYLAPTEDLAAVRAVLSFLDKRFDLAIDFTQLDARIKAQEEGLAALRLENTEIDKYIRTLEVGLHLSEEEQLTLARGVTDYLDKAAR